MLPPPLKLRMQKCFNTDTKANMSRPQEESNQQPCKCRNRHVRVRLSLDDVSHLHQTWDKHSSVASCWTTARLSHDRIHKNTSHPFLLIRCLFLLCSSVSADASHTDIRRCVWSKHTACALVKLFFGSPDSFTSSSSCHSCKQIKSETVVIAELSEGGSGIRIVPERLHEIQVLNYSEDCAATSKQLRLQAPVKQDASEDRDDDVPTQQLKGFSFNRQVAQYVKHECILFSETSEFQCISETGLFLPSHRSSCFT